MAVFSFFMAFLASPLLQRALTYSGLQNRARLLSSSALPQSLSLRKHMALFEQTMAINSLFSAFPSFSIRSRHQEQQSTASWNQQALKCTLPRSLSEVGSLTGLPRLLLTTIGALGLARTAALLLSKGLYTLPLPSSCSSSPSTSNLFQASQQSFTVLTSRFNLMNSSVFLVSSGSGDWEGRGGSSGRDYGLLLTSSSHSYRSCTQLRMSVALFRIRCCTQQDILYLGPMQISAEGMDSKQSLDNLEGDLTLGVRMPFAYQGSSWEGRPPTEGLKKRSKQAVNLKRKRVGVMNLLTRKQELEDKDLVLIDSIQPAENMFAFLRQNRAVVGLDFDEQGRPVQHSILGSVQEFMRVDNERRFKHSSLLTKKNSKPKKRVGRQVVTIKDIQERIQSAAHLERSQDRTLFQEKVALRQSVKKLELIEAPRKKDWYREQQERFERRREIDRMLEFMSKREYLHKNFQLSLRNQNKDQLQRLIQDKSNSLVSRRRPDSSPNNLRFFQDRKNLPLLLQRLQEYQRLLQAMLLDAQYLEVRGVSKFEKERHAEGEWEKPVPELEEDLLWTEQLIECWESEYLRKNELQDCHKATRAASRGKERSRVQS